MAFIKDTLVPSSTYNSLPHISEVNHAPKDFADDLNDLRALLRDHDVPNGISVRLIHKHFDVDHGEVMAFKQVPVPLQGEVVTMGPTMSKGQALHGIHFFVQDDGTFQAYEYIDDDVPDMSNYQNFLSQFGRTVLEKGLQRVFGLKFSTKEEKSWTEFEFPGKRSTVMIPEGMPVPDKVDYSFEVVTEWGKAEGDFRKRGCSHCSHLTTCSNHRRADDEKDFTANEFTLGGQKIDLMSPVFPIMNAVAAVW
ncbi:hypothetical protein ACHAPO_012097 [Fusarium lateritium]